LHSFPTRRSSDLVAMLSLGIGLQQLASRRLMRSGLFDTVVVTSRREGRGAAREEGEWTHVGREPGSRRGGASCNGEAAQRERGQSGHSLYDRITVRRQTLHEDDFCAACIG